jgi:MoxR-like ATPase
MLEAMQEKQVSIDGNTHPLSSPFMIIAGQVPYGSEGTYPLTDVQTDRFMFRAWSEYMDKEAEARIIEKIDYLEEPDVKNVVSVEEIFELQQAAQKIHISEKIRDYIVTLVDHIRQDSDVSVAPSTRASIAFYKGARVLALLQERDFAIPDDIKKLASSVLEHRIRLNPEAEMGEITPKDIITRTLEEVNVPKV